MKDYISWRNGVAYYCRRVPSDVLPFVGGKRFVRLSLRTRNQAEARKKALAYNDFIEDYWASCVRSGGDDDERRYKAAVKMAKAYGFVYKSAKDVVYSDGRDDADVVARLFSAFDNETVSGAVPALLGGVAPPLVCLSQCIDVFEAGSADLIAGKTGLQRRAWLNPRKKAMNNLIEVVGDISVQELERAHVLRLRDWWLERINRDGVTANSANKDFTYCKQVLGRVSLAKDLALDVAALFAGVMLKEKAVSRQPFDLDYIKGVILKPGTLDGLNEECRMLVWAMIDTGCRNAELIGLLPDEICLDARVPHIIVQPNSVRPLKTRESERKIPLVGMALRAFKVLPYGFEHYRHADLTNATNAIGKFFSHNGLNPSRRHSLYSFRHSFKDRLRAVDAPDEMLDALMGHKTNKPKYGSGYTLEAKRRWLDKIVF